MTLRWGDAKPTAPTTDEPSPYTVDQHAIYTVFIVGPDGTEDTPINFALIYSKASPDSITHVQLVTEDDVRQLSTPLTNRRRNQR
jgi:hypothetical protein